MRYEVYKRIGCDQADFDRINAIFKRIMSEDKWLCNQAQKNLNGGVFVNGELHPRKEKGPIYFQQRLREIVYGHRKQEEAAHDEIWPAQHWTKAVSVH